MRGGAKEQRHKGIKKSIEGKIANLKESYCRKIESLVRLSVDEAP